MDISLHTLITICSLVFLAGFIDSIAGGGGLISIPAYLITGIPVHFAYGTNKLSATFGTLFSSARYLKSGYIHPKSVLASVIGSLIGAYLGSNAVLLIDDIYLKYCLVVLLPVIAVFIITRKSFGEADTSDRHTPLMTIMLSFAIGLLIGAYDGFFGPGTGTFLTLAYTGIIGFDIKISTGNAKLVNLASNLASLLVFLSEGKVLLAVGIPAAVFGILGNWIGSGLVIKNGIKIIRPIFIVVFVLLLAKILLDFN